MLDPRDPDQKLAITGGNDNALWLNAKGQRFTNEIGFDKHILTDVLDQDPTHYFAIFDESSRDELSMRGREWIKNHANGHPVLDNPDAAHKAASLEELAAMTGLSADALLASVERFNSLIDAGDDEDFGRSRRSMRRHPGLSSPPSTPYSFFPCRERAWAALLSTCRRGH